MIFFQTEAEDLIHYAVINLSILTEEIETKTTEQETRETVSSDVASFGWE